MPSEETPLYEAVEPGFIAPHYIKKGTVFRSNAPPGAWLHPLNDAARRAMENWLNEEIDETDDGGKKTGAKTRFPARQKMIDSSNATEVSAHSFELVQAAPEMSQADIAETYAGHMTRPATAYSPPPPLKPRMESLYATSPSPEPEPAPVGDRPAKDPELPFEGGAMIVSEPKQTNVELAEAIRESSGKKKVG